ncbi:MAG TPA: hypothetical protein VL157_16235 [Gemmatimonadaceae bacterium]|nr:hypothetical protein [Gemmatimonadaceae bacterium]
MVDPDVVELAQVLAIVGTFAIVMIGCVVAGLTIVKRRPRERPALDDNRLQHLEQAVDAIALEVERISEGQRFTTRLLAQRQADGAAIPAEPARVPRSDPTR